MTVEAPWIKKIDGALAALSKSFGIAGAIPFPQEELVEHLQAIFKQNALAIEINQRGWVEPTHAFEGMADQRAALKIFFTPLQAPIYFVTTEQDLKFLMSELLGGQAACAPFFEHGTMMGFYHYLGLEVLATIDKSGFAPNLAPRLEGAHIDFEQEIVQGPSYVIDLFAKGQETTFAGKVFISESFRDAWERHFAMLPKPALTREQREKIAVELCVEMGLSRLSLKEWREVNLGDLVLLDEATMDPSGKGRVFLSMNGVRLFRGKLSADGIKLLEYPLYEGVGESMDDQFENQEESDLSENDEPVLTDEQASLEETIKAEKIPLLLTVEAGRIRMSAEELMQLTPGTVLDLKVRPEQPVDLVINGKRVGRGELVKVGEVLGVRILQL